MKESNCRIQNTLTPKVISASIYVYIDEVMHLEKQAKPGEQDSVLWWKWFKQNKPL